MLNSNNHSEIKMSETTFIPEEKVGSIICLRAASIVNEDSKQRRRAAIKECAQFLRATHLVGKEAMIHCVAYGCSAAGDRGLLVLSSFNSIVSGPSEPPNG